MRWSQGQVVGVARGSHVAAMFTPGRSAQGLLRRTLLWGLGDIPLHLLLSFSVSGFSLESSTVNCAVLRSDEFWNVEDSRALPALRSLPTQGQCARSFQSGNVGVSLRGCSLINP